MKFIVVESEMLNGDLRVLVILGTRCVPIIGHEGNVGKEIIFQAKRRLVHEICMKELGVCSPLDPITHEPYYDVDKEIERFEP